MLQEKERKWKERCRLPTKYFVSNYLVSSLSSPLPPLCYQLMLGYPMLTKLRLSVIKHTLVTHFIHTHNTMYWHLYSALSKYAMCWFYSNYYTLGLRGIKYIGLAVSVYRYIKTISHFCFPPPSPSSPFHLEPMSLACVVPGGNTLLRAHHSLSPHNERCSHLPQATGDVTQNTPIVILFMEFKSRK